MGGGTPLLPLYGFMERRGKNFKLIARYQDLIYMYTVPRMALNCTNILKLLLKYIILFAITNKTTGIYL